MITKELTCKTCGRTFPVDLIGNPKMDQMILRICTDCPACARERENGKREAKRQELEQELSAERQAALPQLAKKSGIPERYTFLPPTEPPVRSVAEWVWRNRTANLLLSGETGTGKSTSVCYVAVRLLGLGQRCRYFSMRKLLADWRDAKTSDQRYATERLLSELFQQDVLMIDEVVGKARISESGQELLFDLLESVNNGECSARIWLLGNFYSGSIEEIFDDAEPVRRRLQENFVCTMIDRDGTLKPIEVWKGLK